jgi:arylamine N-acetyltransferase
MLLLVQIGKKRWLADVGFGSSYPDLIDFDTRDEQVRIPVHSVQQCVNTLI